MTDNKKEPTFELHSWFDGGDIFFRVKDKKRLAEAVDAIVENDLGVALIGSNEVILDHYCRMLVTRMRDVDRFQLEVFLPLTTESLLTRFNDMLTAITMEQAVRPPAPEQPVRLLVVNDARMVNDEQWSLLVRLLADFPGVNARLVLVINKSGWPGHEKLLYILGKKMHRWMIEAPAADEARALLDAAVERGYQAETEALLIEAGMGALVGKDEQKDEQADLEEYDPDLPNLPELDVDVLLGVAASDEFDHDQMDAETNAESDGNGDQRVEKGIRFWPIIMLIAISIAVSLLIISSLYPDYLRPDRQSSDVAAPAVNYSRELIAIPTDEELETKRLKAQADLVSAQAESEAKIESDTESKVKIESTDQSPADAVPVEEALSEELLTEEPVIAEPVIEEPVIAEQVTEPSAAEVSAPASPLQRAAEIIASAPRSAYFVQHIVLSSELAAKSYRGRYPALGGANVVPVRLSQNNAYAVISGPFDSRSAAALFTQNSPVADDYWIRGAAQLQAILRR
jgi:hypothetical protein